MRVIPPRMGNGRINDRAREDELRREAMSVMVPNRTGATTNGETPSGARQGALAAEVEPVRMKLGCVTSPGSSYDATPGAVRVHPSGSSETS